MVVHQRRYLGARYVENVRGETRKIEEYSLEIDPALRHQLIFISLWHRFDQFQLIGKCVLGCFLWNGQRHINANFVTNNQIILLEN